MVLKQLDIHIKNKINLDTDFMPFIKIKVNHRPKCIIKLKVIKLLEDNIGEKTLDDLV